MKVYNFLNKFHYACSSIKEVYVGEEVGQEERIDISLVINPKEHLGAFEKELCGTVRSFIIKDDKLIIYVKK